MAKCGRSFDSAAAMFWNETTPNSLCSEQEKSGMQKLQMVLGQHLSRIIHSWRGCRIGRGNIDSIDPSLLWSKQLFLSHLMRHTNKHTFCILLRNEFHESKKKRINFVFVQIRNFGLGGRTCLDSPARKKDLKKAVGLYPCHNQGGNQVNKENRYWCSEGYRPRHVCEKTNRQKQAASEITN